MLPFSQRPLADWIKVFDESPDGVERYRALVAIHLLAEADQAVEVCLRGLGDADSGVRARAARQLGDWIQRTRAAAGAGETGASETGSGQTASSETPSSQTPGGVDRWSAVADELQQKLEDDDSDVRFEAARALGRARPDARQAGQVLIELLNDPETQPLMVAAVLGALAERPDQEPSLIPRLKDLLIHPQAEVRENASLVISRKVDAARGLIAELVVALDDEEPIVRENSAIALERAGVSEPEVLSALSAAEQDEDEGVAAAARSARQRLSGR